MAEVDSKITGDGYKLILHTIPPGKTAPNVSPYVLKLETYMRMAGIKYTIDTKNPFGSKGKTPWITYNGKDLDDSELIIDFLNRTFSKDIWANATKEEKAIGQAMRIMLEAHFSLAIIEWRWVTDVENINKIMAVSGIKAWVMKKVAGRKVKGLLWDQGIGRHSKEDQLHILKKDLVAVVDYLGTKPYFLGYEPTEIDSAIFGMLAQIVYCAPGSPWEKLTQEEFPTIKSYCERMKNKFWEDWDSILITVAK